jgi:hypothetical protein
VGFVGAQLPFCLFRINPRLELLQKGFRIRGAKIFELDYYKNNFDYTKQSPDKIIFESDKRLFGFYK